MDSLPDIIASFQYALESQKLPVPSDVEVRALFGLPLEDNEIQADLSRLLEHLPARA